MSLSRLSFPVYGKQEHSAYNGHFESTYYHPPAALQEGPVINPWYGTRAFST